MAVRGLTNIHSRIRHYIIDDEFIEADCIVKR